MTFWYDKPSNMLVYPNLPMQTQDFALKYADAIQVTRPNSHSFGDIAVEATLENMQKLRLLRLPVLPPVTDENYDWPIRAPYYPREHQRIMTNFMVLHPRSFNLSDMGCVGGETLIDTSEGKIEIRTLSQRGTPIKVRTATGGYVLIPAPFMKGWDHLYRVCFASGRSIVCTKKHVFLTLRGWVSCAALVAGEQLPVFVDDLPASTSESGLSVSLVNDLRSKQTISSFSAYSNNLFYGEQPQWAKDTDQVSIPLQVDVQTHNRALLQMDVQDNECRYTDLHAEPFLRSMPHYDIRFDQGETGCFRSECATTQNGNRYHISARYRLFPNLFGEAPEDQELQLCIPSDAASRGLLDRVVSISYERSGVYYDMQVPKHENYIAHGLCHHNTMKTLASLWAADFIMKRNPGQKALIVCPLSIMRRVWADALFTHFMGRRKCTIVHGTSNVRMRALDTDADFYIINHDGICVGIEYDTKNRIIIKEHTVPYAIKNRPDINIVIVDEASAFRNGASRRSRVARAIFTNKPYLWPLTGTPTSNGPLDAHGLAKLVNGAFGEPYTSYKNRVMVQVTNFKRVPRPGAHIEAHKLLQPSIRFQMRDCTDVPPCTEETRDVALSAEQKEKYNELKRELVLDLGQDKKLTVAHEAALRLKLIQISCGALYDHEHATHFIDCKPRIAELKAVLDEAPTKVIVFAPLTSVVHMLYKQGLKWWKKDGELGTNDRFSCECITGEVKPRDRNGIFRRFQSESSPPNILYADPGTMSHGLDLFAASVVVWYGPTDRTEVYLQANRRIDRPGQRTHTTIVRLASTPVEREIYRRLSANQNMQGLILGLAKEGDGNGN